MSINAIGSVTPALMPVISPIPVKPQVPNDVTLPSTPPAALPKGVDSQARMESLLANQVQAGSLSQKQASSLSTFFANLAVQGQRPGGLKELSGTDMVRKGDEPSEDEEGSEEAIAEKRPSGRVRGKSARPAKALKPLKPLDPVLSEALAVFVKNLKEAQSNTTVYGVSALARSIASNDPMVVDEIV